MKFSVPEISKDEMFSVSINSKFKNNTYKILEECAKFYYWGLSGWDKAWPLYFNLYTDNDYFIATADISILSAYREIEFDIIIKSGITYMEGHRV